MDRSFVCMANERFLKYVATNKIILDYMRLFVHTDAYYYRISGNSFRSVMQETNPICFTSTQQIGCRGDSFEV